MISCKQEFQFVIENTRHGCEKESALWMFLGVFRGFCSGITLAAGLEDAAICVPQEIYYTDGQGDLGFVIYRNRCCRYIYDRHEKHERAL
ncbi:AAEL011119-PA [Aedes aegypti]|uniref:AAEL011119-PA n=1 Tax=Aedes aegypti TaxID=7159 RepID=Q16QY6_AEDAE|nr:AAEL011119-PA [Aedes aegypti]